MRGTSLEVRLPKRSIEALSRLGQSALDLLYPRRCVLCSRNGTFLCSDCLDTLPAADGARCDACWLPLDAWSRANGCRKCVEHPLALTQLRSVFRYEGDVRRLVHDFKFRGYRCLEEVLGASIAEVAVATGFAVDAIVAVPLTGSRRRQRGFNQPSLLAERVARALDTPVAEPLVRRRSLVDQARSATAADRWRNVEGAFALAPGARVEGHRFLLIDDVATTGATLDACARFLLDGGAASVSGLTLARED